MKTKLTANDLIPFLGKNLKVKTKLGEVYILIGIAEETCYLQGLGNKPCDIQDVTPLLYPMSELGNEMLDDAGEAFYPYQYLGYSYPTDLIIDGHYIAEDYAAEYGESPRYRHDHFESKILFDKLYELHFDVEGLIKQGLAKPIYTHKSDCAIYNEPYMKNGECDCKIIGNLVDSI